MLSRGHTGGLFTVELVSEIDVSEELIAIPESSEGDEGQAETYKLAANLRGEDAAELAGHLLELRGRNLVLDICELERIDTPCVQVLLSAAQLWRGDECSITIDGQAEVLETTLGLLGINPDRIQVGV